MSSRRAMWAFLVAVALVGAAVLIVALQLSAGRRPAPRFAPVVLDWDVPDALEEGTPPWRPLTPDFLRPARATVFDVVHTLDHASHDSHVRGLVLHIDGSAWGWAKLGEVRDAVARFRAAGKRVYAVVEAGGDAEYFLASVAERVALPPAVVLQVNGLVASATYARGTFDKLGVKPQFAHAGQFKSATEFYTRTDMSAPARKALDAMLDDVYRVYVDSLASSRHRTSEAVRGLIDQGPFTALEARRLGLVDTLAYGDEIDSLAVRRAGHGADIESFARYADGVDDGGGSHVAFLQAAGTIAAGRSRLDPLDGLVLGQETLVKQLRDLRDRGSIKAVVLRIDSPGGDAVASDAIWDEVRRLNAKKPVIVSMSDLAASGGYYIAAPATKIVAGPNTLTGSIGVFGGKFNILGLYRKLGLNVESIARGKHAQMMSPYEDWTPDEAQRFQSQIDQTYQLFLRRVAEGRHASTAAIDSVGQGRVWTGSAAVGLGLVDRLGNIPTACRMAFRAAGLDPSHPLDVEVFPRRERTFVDRWLEDWMDESDRATNPLASLPPVLRAWLAAERFPAGSALALMPWSIRIR